MDEIFLIYVDYNDWDTESGQIGFVNSKEDAIAMCEKFGKFYETTREVSEEVQKKVKHLWEKDYDAEEGSDWPKWPAGIAKKDITVEMREERDSIKKENELISERNSKKYKEQRDGIINAVSTYINALDYDEETMKYIKEKIGDTGDFYSHLTYYFKKLNKLS